jgi:putative Holliday junction resolvase
MTRVLGIDPGTKRCGIAVTNSDRTMAFPRPALARDEHTLERLRVLVEDEAIGAIVIGRPVALSGRDTASTADADHLYEEVRRFFDEVTVTQFDERLTTQSAQKSLSEAGLTTKGSRERIDGAAAVIMLQNYLDGLNAE